MEKVVVVEVFYVFPTSIGKTPEIIFPGTDILGVFKVVYPFITE